MRSIINWGHASLYMMGLMSQPNIPAGGPPPELDNFINFFTFSSKKEALFSSGDVSTAWLGWPKRSALSFSTHHHEPSNLEPVELRFSQVPTQKKHRERTRRKGTADMWCPSE